ncbi:tryptophan synthase alpha chain [Pyxidicoccus xibeiensis]|uniref:tryptophan synthase alpha chain n=1 Tax=Pyxidicoccus xibeiensis TaxID=2906759 RepID=UPI0020A6F427|nr:tryptophan synthase alpha chain [Pyxidicoccus xibeiensis]MCP3137029.1 tryptophan synthase alpha chain [Pyxidicoccus xibeiensis]
MRGERRLGAGFWVWGLVVWVACSSTNPPSEPHDSRQPSHCLPMTCASQGMDCGIAIDGCGGTLACGTCPTGQTCGGGGRYNVCGTGPCVPTTCEALGGNCGQASDGCGGVLECGACTAPETCGGAGTPNVCGRPACTPDTCESLGKNCGTVPDGCGDTLECGACAPGETCGGGGAANVCGTLICMPSTCASLGKNCGPVSDGCGGMLDCGTCPDGEACGGDAVPNVCGKAPCTPTTCEALAKNCGTVPDGCGATLECGTCPTGLVCGGGGTPNVCGGGVCTPTTCQALGMNCGSVADGCGGMLECGACTSPETCGGGGVPNVCGRPACTPTTCEALGKDCGTVPDGCGGALECGTCEEGQTCGGGGTPNVCAPPACRPYTCGLLGKNCGPVEDGCGGTLDCGMCTAPEACGAADVPNVCAATQPVCTDRELGSALPVTVKGSTAHAGDDHVATCGGRPAPDRGFRWTAPRSGTFTFDTARSALRSLVSVRRDGCGGAELACATDGISYGGGARVSAALTQGQTVLVVVDSASGDRFSAGYFELHIDALRASEAGACFDNMDNDGDRWVDCADTDCQGTPGCGGRGCAHHDLGSALPVTFQGETAGSGDGFQGTCGALLQQDRAHLWTAPRAGTFVFDTSPGGWGNALYVLTGCRGTELGCSANPRASARGSPAVKVTLTQGQTVLVVVDGMANPDQDTPIRYTLHVSEHAPTEAAHCSDGADNDADGRADAEDDDCE